MATMDDNGKQVLYGVSHEDGITPVRIKFNSSGKMLIDTTTTIEFDPSVIPQDSETLLAKATSSDDGTIAPWVVNSSTGAVLASI